MDADLHAVHVTSCTHLTLIPRPSRPLTPHRSVTHWASPTTCPSRSPCLTACAPAGGSLSSSHLCLFPCCLFLLGAGLVCAGTRGLGRAPLFHPRPRGGPPCPSFFPLRLTPAHSTPSACPCVPQVLRARDLAPRQDLRRAGRQRGGAARRGAGAWQCACKHEGEREGPLVLEMPCASAWWLVAPKEK